MWMERASASPASAGIRRASRIASSARSRIQRFTCPWRSVRRSGLSTSKSRPTAAAARVASIPAARAKRVPSAYSSRISAELRALEQVEDGVPDRLRIGRDAGQLRDPRQREVGEREGLCRSGAGTGRSGRRGRDPRPAGSPVPRTRSSRSRRACASTRRSGKCRGASTSSGASTGTSSAAGRPAARAQLESGRHSRGRAPQRRRTARSGPRRGHSCSRGSPGPAR